jgi:hypothetical protein
MSHPWDINSSAYGRKGASEAWKKDFGKEKEGERWRSEGDPKDSFKLRDKIIRGHNFFNLFIGKDDDHDELDMDIEEDDVSPLICVLAVIKLFSGAVARELNAFGLCS